MLGTVHYYKVCDVRTQINGTFPVLEIRKVKPYRGNCLIPRKSQKVKRCVDYGYQHCNSYTITLIIIPLNLPLPPHQFLSKLFCYLLNV
jgi:hypothetical protein